MAEKLQIENDFSNKFAQQKKELDSQLEDMEQKMANTEEQSKQINRDKLQTESEFAKQKALLDQKIQFLEKSLEDSSKREKEIATELRNCKKDFLNQNKQQT